jgi:uncharacterized protein (DUF1786 family)
MSLLAIDVGAGTQDILLYREDVPLEGSTKMVFPSRTVIVAGRIREAKERGRDIFLRGPTMGGGACARAVKEHLAAGLCVYATPSAAATLNDNLGRVAAMGVTIVEDGGGKEGRGQSGGGGAAGSAQVIETGDIDIAALGGALRLFDVDLPADIAVAVQDHGFSPHRSNRLVRFEHLAAAIASGGRLRDFAYREPPQAMSRMTAVKDVLLRAGKRPLLMDTGPAAVFGAAQDLREGRPALVINFGNGHTVAAVLVEGRITALFEHHTADLSPGKLRGYVEKLCNGTLNSEEIFQDGGHGSYMESTPEDIGETLVTGPQRQMFLRSGALPGARAAAPAGDMMIAGCIGLLSAWRAGEDLWR